MTRVLHVGFGFRPLRWGGLIAYAEDLMDAQVARGEAVGYFFAGRAYPLLSGPRLKRWRRRDVRMFEVVNSPIVIGGESGTADPLGDLAHPAIEAMFARALDEHDADVVHVHELLGLPSSLISVARERGVPIMMTAQDYGVLCPTIKLFDAEGRNCRRVEPGAMCVECCRDAPPAQQRLVDDTVFYEEERFLRRTRLQYVPRPRPLVAAVRTLAGAVLDDGGDEAEAPPAPEPVPAAAYDERRRVNADRLGELDLLVAMSRRVYEIHRDLGVPERRMRHVSLTLAHIDAIRPHTQTAVDGPVRFVTLAGCASREKGTDVVLGALKQLRALGLGPDDFRLSVYGYLEERARTVLADDPAVTCAGIYGPEDMSDICARHHVGIVPSVWEECYGYVGVEMLAGGLPVIGNAVGGILDYVIDGETGWRNQACDGAGLAAIMASIVGAPEEARALNGTVIRRRAEFVKPLSVHVDEIAGLYAEIAA